MCEILCVLAFVAFVPPAPITFSSRILPATVQVGDEFELRITATWQRPVVRVTPALEQWAGPFEIVRLEASQPAASDGAERQTWIIRLRTFDRGHLAIPPAPFDYQLIGDAERGRAEAAAPDLDVLVPVVDEKGTIKPLKPAIEPGRTPIDLALGAAEFGLIVLGVGWVVWATRALVQARRRTRALRRFDPAVALRQLVSSFPTTADDYEGFYTTVSALTRQSLEDRFAIPATVLSSTEIVNALDQHPAATGEARNLRDTLTFVDIVRFGGRHPTTEESRLVLQQTRSLLLRRA